MAPRSTKKSEMTTQNELKNILRNVFQNSYTSYNDFKNIVLNTIFSKYSYTELFEDFVTNDEYKHFFEKQSIEHFFEKGKYRLENNKILTVYEIIINKSVKIHRARVGIQSLLRQATFMRTGQSALMIFRYANPENRSWRLSYMAKTGDIEGNVHYTAAKRYTYILGPECHVRTAVDRFAGIAGKSIRIDDLTAAFSVEAVTKEFYTKLFDWYEWALGLDKKKYPNCNFNVTFPNNIETANDDREENTLRQHMIRLITRLIFVWFIKQKGLVAKELFDVKVLKTILKDFDEFAGRDGKGCKPQEESTTNYYHAILQNLFFATLNNEMGKAKDKNGNIRIDKNGKPLDNRRFAYDGPDESKRTEEYCVKTVYRYDHDLTEGGKTKLLELFARTPFLNGGLFECLDTDDKDKKKGKHSAIYRDGFSRETRMNGDNFACRAFIPNILFFNDDENQPGLITLLNQYNFTIEENTPDEEQVALDPELLGKIFENLLASYNPETAKTARKSTGSYYTPREIVHYMAEQSIAECLKTKLKRKFCNGKKALIKSEALEQAIDDLMQGEECPKALELARPDIEIALLGMKILDPACGSGAFPMGVMQVMLNILSKIKDNYNEKQHEYKLKIIQNCLYGVDIQPIAVQIAKLRCFITLIVDEIPDLKNPDNLGITVLPNLETKFVCANSLIPLDDALKTPETKQKSLIDTWLDKVNNAKKELWDIRARHFTAKTFHEKKQLRNDDEVKRNELRELYQEAKVSSTEIEKLLSWNPYDQTASNSFFDPEWMLGVNDGFDVVIGNPPYIRVQNLEHQIIDLYKTTYKTAHQRLDISILFFEFALKVLNNQGLICYISSKQFLTTEYGLNARQLFYQNTYVKRIVDFGYLKVFPNTTTYVSIFFLNKTKTDSIQFSRVRHLPFIPTQHYSHLKYHNLNNEPWSLGDEDISAIIKKLSNGAHKLSEVAKSITGVITGCDRLLMSPHHEDINIEKQFILPIVRSEGCCRFGKAKPTKYVYYPYITTVEDTSLVPIDDINTKYPLLNKFIMCNKEILKTRKDSRRLMGERVGWYGLVRYGKMKNYSQIKILTPGEVNHNKFCIDFTGSGFSCARVFGIIPNDSIIDIYYLLGILNSNVCEFYLHLTASPKDGGYYAYSANTLESIPIVIDQENAVIDLVHRIMKTIENGKDAKHLENELNHIVYNIYKLSQQDIETIENELV